MKGMIGGDLELYIVKVLSIHLRNYSSGFDAGFLYRPRR